VVAWRDPGLHPIFSPHPHFPLAPKRFMVLSCFAVGEIEILINIKGLAKG
jgi:hypothetical protein